MKHLEYRKLVDHFEGLLSGAELQEVSDHISGCTECTAQIRRLENFFSYVGTDKYAQADQATTARLLNIYSRPIPKAKKISAFRKLAATLVFDDWQIATNERLHFSDTRQILYKAGEFEIDLRLNFTGDMCQVSGQVFPGCSDGSIELRSPDHSESGSIDEHCEFQLPPIDQGTYQVILVIDGDVLEISDLSLFA